MINRKAKKEIAGGDTWEVFSRAASGPGIVGAELIAGSIKNRRVDVRGLDFVDLSSSRCEGVEFFGFSPASFPITGAVPSVFVRCVFNSVAGPGALNLGHAEYVDCSFVDVRVGRLDSSDACLVGCLFEGACEVACFSVEDSLRGFASSPLALRLERCDFRRFRCRSLEFRGGIDLRSSVFDETGGDVVLYDVPGCIAQLLASGRAAVYSAEQIRLINFFEKWSQERAQADLYLSKALLLRYSNEEAAVVKDLVEIRG